MWIEIYLLPRKVYDKTNIKQINIPDDEFSGDVKEDLDTILIYGVKHGLEVGDLIQYNNQIYRIKLTGFELENSQNS